MKMLGMRDEKTAAVWKMLKTAIKEDATHETEEKMPLRSTGVSAGLHVSCSELQMTSRIMAVSTNHEPASHLMTALVVMYDLAFHQVFFYVQWCRTPLSRFLYIRIFLLKNFPGALKLLMYS